MKKYLLGICFLSFLSCGDSGDSDNQTFNSSKIQTLTIQDENITNGNASLSEKLDFQFEYNQNKLVKVWDLHNNYTENLTYNNNSLSAITINGYIYPDLASHQPLNVKRNIVCDANNKIISSENPIADFSGNTTYTLFEYPSSDIIIAKYYNKYLNNPGVLKETSKIFLNNGNVTKVQFAYDNSPVFTKEVRYEYDQKSNPNSLIDRNRILALPEYAFNVFMLQDYSQISKNNVVVKKSYWIYPSEILLETTNFHYNYQNNDLPGTIYLQYDYPGNTGLKVSAIYGY